MNIKDFVLQIGYLNDGKRAVKYIDSEQIIKGYDDGLLSLRETGGENAVRVVLNARTAIRLTDVKLVYDRYFEPTDAFFANGYQSWTLSREYRSGDVQNGLNPLCRIPLIKKFAAPSGDYAFTQYGNKLYHSFSYTYVRSGEKVELFGSLDERTGYTIFYADMRENVFAVVKDVDGVTVLGDYTIVDIVRFMGDYDSCFDAYFEALPNKRTGRVTRLVGYTSWYNYYQNIDEKIILRDLDGIAQAEGANIFQIDDGFETAVGDWEVDENKFPNGLLPIVEKIHSKGLKAGLWLAPFGAQFKSKLAKEHPEWIIRNEKGKPVVAGMNWGGFYALDVQNERVKEYIRTVFDRVFDEWGFDMVKLDFLYAACIIPYGNKSRGRLMCEAMEFLRECCRDRIILGCGVPLAPSFGIVDACRIGCDAEISFEDKFYAKLTNQEIVSTKNAMTDTVFRRHLRRIFANDPDVFFLRKGGYKEAKYTDEQKRLLAKVNNMFGDVLFVSDDVGEYDEEQRALLAAGYAPFEGKVLSAEFVSPTEICVKYEQNSQIHTFKFDIYTGRNEDKI